MIIVIVTMLPWAKTINSMSFSTMYISNSERKQKYTEKLKKYSACCMRVLSRLLLSLDPTAKTTRKNAKLYKKKKKKE